MDNKPPRKQFNIRLTTPIITAIEQEATRRQVSKTYIVEKALLAWLDRHHDPFAGNDDR